MPYKHQQFGMNNIVKLLLKKGLVSDLAKITHSLDLSSPHVAATANAALKPLEILTRIVNTPSAVPARLGSSSAKSKTGAAGQAADGGNRHVDSADAATREAGLATASAAAGLTGGNETNTTNSEATRAQGDEQGVEPDPEATEHDISTAAESIEPNSESQMQVGGIDPIRWAN